MTGTSILIVRQVPAHATPSTPRAGLCAVWLPAALAAFGRAVTGRARTTASPRAPLVLACAVPLTGLVGVLDAVLPARPNTLLQSIAPEPVHPLASALVAPLGLALAVIACGLARRKRRAHRAAVGLLAGLVVLHVLHGFGYGAAAALFVAVALVARRQAFDAPGDPETQPRLLVHGLVAAAGLYVYGAAALWINRMAADQPFSPAFAVRGTTAALAGVTLRGSTHVGDGFGRWFPLSVFLGGAATAVWPLATWLAPWRYRLRQEARERQLARDLVAAWGVDTLAPFVLRADKSYFFGKGERAFLAYRVVGGVAVVSGDPIGPPDEYDALVSRFIRFAHERDWRLAILGASERYLALDRRHGLHALYHGDEAVLEVGRFSLHGRPIRKMRQSVHSLEHAGYRAEVLHPGEIGDELRACARVGGGAQLGLLPPARCGRSAAAPFAAAPAPVARGAVREPGVAAGLRRRARRLGALRPCGRARPAVPRAGGVRRRDRAARAPRSPRRRRALEAGVARRLGCGGRAPAAWGSRSAAAPPASGAAPGSVSRAGSPRRSSSPLSRPGRRPAAWPAAPASARRPESSMRRATWRRRHPSAAVSVSSSSPPCLGAESVPGGLLGVARIVAFAAVVAGAALLARPEVEERAALHADAVALR